jgi:hypothetical protein
MLKSRIIGTVTGRLVLSIAFCAGPAFAACASSWSNGYAYCRMLTVNHTQVAATLSNFTVMVSVALPSAHIQNANCYDCIFTSDNAGSTLLNWEAESYAAGSLVAHVLIGSLSNSSDTQFYIFYGKAGVSSFQGGTTGSAWDANYVAIQHLSTLPASAVDSISGVSGTIANVTATTGEIGGGGSFNGTSSSIDMLPASATTDRFAGDFTLSAWFNTSSTGYQVILGKETSGSPDEWILAINAHAAGTMELWDQTAQTYAYAAYTGSAWQHGVCLRASGTMNCYVNGTVGTSAASSTNFVSVSGYNDLFIGERQYTSFQEWFNGAIDEVRVSNVARSASWITTEYNNQKPGSNLVTLGGEVSLAHKVSHRVIAN